MKIKLLNNKVLVQNEEEKKNKTVSGLVLPDGSGEEKIKTAKVVAVGSGLRGEGGKRVALDVKEGDKVMYEYTSYGTKEIEIKGEKYYLISESDIIGII